MFTRCFLSSQSSNCYCTNFLQKQVATISLFLLNKLLVIFSLFKKMVIYYIVFQSRFLYQRSVMQQTLKALRQNSCKISLHLSPNSKLRNPCTYHHRHQSFIPTHFRNLLGLRTLIEQLDLPLLLSKCKGKLHLGTEMYLWLAFLAKFWRL